MGYAHIENLYRPEAQKILAFRQCHALEKVHGTSAHIRIRAVSEPSTGTPCKFDYFSGGESHANFVKIFDEAVLREKFCEIGHQEVTVHGEAYGGRCQGMRTTYGDALRFIAFDVKIGDLWLSVPDADDVVRQLGLEFVPRRLVSTDLAVLDAERDRPSEVAERRGCGSDKLREGVVLRPPFEVVLSSGNRVCAKHKRPEFSERVTLPKVNDPEKLRVLENADEIAREWVTEMRLTHVLDKLSGADDVSATGDVVRAMVSDIEREAAGEVVMSKEAKSAIGRRAAALFKARVAGRLKI